MVLFSLASEEDLPRIRQILRAAWLSTKGLENCRWIIKAMAGDRIVGVGAIEVYGRYALTRSVAVERPFRRQGIASRLMRTRLEQCRKEGIIAVYALVGWRKLPLFQKLGYEVISRSELPMEIRNHWQFSSFLYAVLLRPFVRSMCFKLNNPALPTGSPQKGLTNEKMTSPSWSFEQTRQHWNSRFRKVKSFQGAPSTQYYRRSEMRLIKDCFGDLRDKKFLKTDVWNEARNTGILYWVAEQGAEVTALDISDELVLEVKQKFRKMGIPATILHSDIRQITLPDNTCDFLYSMGTVEHIPEVEQAFAEFHRVLKPGGKAIIGVPNLHDPFLRPLLVKLLTIFGRYPYAPERAFSYRDLRKLLEQAGFQVLQRSGILFVPGVLRMLDVFLYLRIPRLTRLTAALLTPFERLENAWPALARHGYLVACVVQKPDL